MHIILGLFFVALGLWGVFDEWYYVLDFLKAAGSLALVLGGAVAMLAAVVSRPPRPESSSEALDPPPTSPRIPVEERT